MAKTRIIFFTALALASCASDADLSLRDGETAPDWDARRARMNVRVLQAGLNGGTTEEELEPLEFEPLVAARCEEILVADASIPDLYSQCSYGGFASTCSEAACLAHLELCMANLYRELAESVATVDLGTDAGGVHTLVPPQRMPVIAGFNEQAMSLATHALLVAGENLKSGAQRADAAILLTDSSLAKCTPASVVANTSGIRLDESLARDLGEAIHLVDEAAREAVQANIAVADAEFSRDPNPESASRSAWAAPVLSRYHAAQLLAGGPEEPLMITGTPEFGTPDFELSLFASSGRCPGDDPSSGADRARDFIGEAGLNPKDVANLHLDFTDLFNGAGTIGAGLGDALFEITGDERLDPTAPDPEGPSAFLVRAGITEADFLEARQHFVFETSAFGRDIEEEMPPLVLATDTPGVPRVYSQPRYVATSVRPQGAPNDYYVQLARRGTHSIDDRDKRDTAQVRPMPEYARRGLAQSLDYALTVAGSILPTTNLSPVALAQVANTISGNMERRPGRVEVCYANEGGDAGHVIRVRALGDYKEDLLLVSGTAGLACATQGSIDGVSCEIAEYVTSPEMVTNVTGTDPGVGFDGGVSMRFTKVDENAAFDMYLVRRRAGAATDATGAYESIAPVYFDAFSSTISTGWSTCNAQPVVSEMQTIVASIISSDTDSCGRPLSPCAGLTDLRLPLEDELIEDGDAFETSWRHHLTVARAAAEHADELGQSVIEIGTEIDRIADAANADLLRACGATVSLDSMFGADPIPLVGGACPTGSCGSGYACVEGTCIRLNTEALAAAGEADHDARILAECLGDDSVEPLAALGLAEICVWRRVDDRGVICEGATADNPCPFARSATDTCVPRSLPSVGHTLESVPVPVNLGFFGANAEEEARTRAIAPLNCDDIRWVRSHLSAVAGSPGDSAVADAAYERILDSNFFFIENAKYWAGRLGWEGRPGDYSVLTLDGTPWLTTGDVFDATPNSPFWPCTSAFPGELPAEMLRTCTAGFEDGLFCARVADACGARDDRAWMNQRLARGVLALAVTTGYGPSNMLLPAHYYTAVETTLPEPVYNYQTVDSHGASLPVSIDGSYPRTDFEGALWDYGTGVRYGTADSHFGGATAVRRDGGVVWTWVDRDRANLAPRAQSPVSPDVMAFLNFGTLPAPNERDGRPTRIPRHLWENRPPNDTGGGDRDVGGQLGWPDVERGNTPILGALRRAPGESVIDGIDWVRGHACNELEDCDPNIADLSGYWTANTERLADGSSDRFRNLAMIARDGFTAGDIADGLEIMCEAAALDRRGGGPRCDPDEPPEVAGRADLPRLRQFLTCSASAIEWAGERIIVQNLPRKVIAEWRAGPSAGDSRADQGEFGQATDRLRDTLVSLHGIPRALGAQLRGAEADLELFELALASLDARREVADLTTLANGISQIAACVGEASGVKLTWREAAVCANAAAQIIISLRVNDLTHVMLDIDGATREIDVAQRLQDRADALAELAETVDRLSIAMDSSLNQLHSARSTARRALARAGFLSSEAGGEEFPLGTGLRNRYDLQARRYREARANAVRLAYISRRALEQRLGMDLEDMGEMTLVPDPAGWANLLCESTGIDYSRLRDETMLPVESTQFMFVGDYVRRLELTFESYRFDFPFTSSTDTAVVSLRDEILNVRAECSSPVPNLLAWSGDLTQSTWAPAEGGCLPVTLADGTEGISGCVAAEPIGGLGGSLRDPFAETPSLGSARGFHVRFAAGAGLEDVSFTEAADLRQQVTVARGGTYLLSWFGRTPSVVGAREAADAVDLVQSDGTGLASSATLFDRLVPDPSGDWARYYRYYSVPRATTLYVRIVPQAPFSSPAEEQSVDLAALMLEDVSGLFTQSVTAINQTLVDGDTIGRYSPRPFVATGAVAGESVRRVCEDTDGTVLRSREWRPGCVRVCAAGYGAACAGDETDGESHCYREIEFSVTQEQIERGELFHRSGFAYGNFNYRVEALGLNFVGTGVRDCSSETFGSSCYSSGSVPYSITHYGPYNVRNHRGNTYEAQLFTGKIERQRGLAAERYITNPISSADHALIDPYMRGELRGRPLPGRYVLRVWDAPGLNFDALEDVQLVLRYRQWTRMD